MLEHPTDDFIKKILKEYSQIEGDQLNDKLQKLFDVFNDDTNKYDVQIKVAALNKIYSTAIININPMVEQICRVSKDFVRFSSTKDFIDLADKISLVEWVDGNNEVKRRNNISFASKYVHFVSRKELPIYDSYIWIIIKAYLAQKYDEKLSFSNPSNYADFYNTFIKFKSSYKLENYSNYNLDKYLWTYGRGLIIKIVNEQSLDLEKAKSKLKRILKSI